MKIGRLKLQGIAGKIARGNGKRPAKRDAQMREITANPGSFGNGI